MFGYDTASGKGWPSTIFMLIILPMFLRYDTASGKGWPSTWLSTLGLGYQSYDTASGKGWPSTANAMNILNNIVVTIPQAVRAGHQQHDDW